MVSNVRTRAVLEELIRRFADLSDETAREHFERDLTDHDRLVYVDDVSKGKPRRSEPLIQQAGNNTKEQFASPPTSRPSS